MYKWKLESFKGDPEKVAEELNNFGSEITKYKIVAYAASHPKSELHKCFKEVPERCFDVGMAEQHAITLAAGLSVGGIALIGGGVFIIIRKKKQNTIKHTPKF